MRNLFVYGGLFFLASLAVPEFVRAATTPLSPIVKPKQEAQPAPQPAAVLTDEDIEQARVKLESRLAELRLQSNPEAVAAMQKAYRDAATPQELQEWERLTNRLVGILESNVRVLIKLGNTRKANRDRALEIKRWQGFPEKPPYPISLLDSLSEAINAKQIDMQSLEAIRTTVEGEAADFANDLKSSRKEVRLAEENVERNAGKPEEPRSKWLLILARLRDSVNQAGAVNGEGWRLAMQEAQEGVQAEIDFLERKLAVARGDYRFSEKDLEEKLRDIDGRRERLQRQLDQAVTDDEKARKLLDAAEAAVSKARSEIGTSTVQLDRLLKELERRRVLFDVADFRVQILKGMLHFLKNEQAIWKNRYRLASGTATQEGGAELKSSRNELAAVAKWKEYISSQLASLQVLINSQREKLSSASIPESESEDLRSILAAYQEKDTLLRRGDAILSEYQQLVLRFDEEMKAGIEQRSLKSRVRGLLAEVSALAARVWNAELYVAEETIIAEGKKIVRPRSVTIGKLVEALIILLAGAWVARRLTKLFRWFATKRLRIGANDAQLYSRMLLYLMVVGILVGALIFVNIPFAFFAFFGGALAIGIGFGAQNLVNNFISGLILMFDHTIRMGDIVEVDGQRGRVTAIGMRSSSIKRFDGVEMLVPNSHFLQQNVTNWTASDRRIRFSVSVGVMYGAPTKETAQIVLKAVEVQPEVLNDPPPYVVFENFADSSLIFTAYFWIEMDPSINSLVVCSDIRHRINERLSEAGIAIPFPQRDVHIDASQPIEIRVINPE
jgi:small-conductance mechanosensitive channel